MRKINLNYFFLAAGAPAAGFFSLGFADDAVNVTCVAYLKTQKFSHAHIARIIKE